METKFLKIVFVIDESGSMQGSNADVIGGFNSFIYRHSNEPNAKVNVSLYKFSHLITQVIANKPVNEVAPLTHADYSPNGFTALYNAIGKAIAKTDEFVESLSENDRPTTVMMVIITDGHENASQIYSTDALKSTIATHEKLLNWKFIYLGADFNNFDDANQLGITSHAAFKKRNMPLKFDMIANAGISYCLEPNDELDTQSLLNDLKD